MVRSKTWKVLEMGVVPEDPLTIGYICPNCGQEAELPVFGIPIAQPADGGIIFDVGPHAMPKRIQCRKCKYVFVCEKQVG